MHTPVSLFLETIKLSWKHKITWLLGLGAIILTTGNEFFFAQTVKQRAGFQNFKNLFTNNLSNAAATAGLPVDSWFYLLILLAIIALIIWITVNSQGALIKKVSQLSDQNETDRNLLLSRLVFWKILLVVLISKLLLIIFSFLLWFMPEWLRLPSTSLTHIASLLIGLILVLAFFALILFERYTVIDQVLNRGRLANSFRRAWSLLFRHPLLNIECILVVIITLLLLSLALLLAQYVSVIIPWLLMLLFSSLGLNGAIVFVGFLVYGLALLIILFFNSWLSAFYHTYWTLVFKNLTDPESSFRGQISHLFKNR